VKLIKSAEIEGKENEKAVASGDSGEESCKFSINASKRTNHQVSSFQDDQKLRRFNS